MALALVSGSTSLGQQIQSGQVLEVQAAGIDIAAAGTLVLGPATATKVEIGATDIVTEIKGTVGIGVVAPNDILHIANSTDAVIALQRLSTSVGDFTGLQFKVSTDLTNGFYNSGIFFERTDEEFSGGGKLHLAMDATSAGNVGVADAKVTILQGGNVGIGGSPGAFKLDVFGNTRVQGKLTVTGIIDPTQLLLTGSDKRLGATDAGSVYLAPFANSTTAVQVREADNTEVVFNVDTLNGRIGIQNATGATPQYRLDIGDASYFAINGSFAHIVQHNSAASTFWSIAPRNGGDLDIAVTTSDPRPTGATVGTSDNAISIKTNKDVHFLAGVELAMGTGTGQASASGKANVNTTAVGNVGAGEDDLMTYSLPANSLSADGKLVKIVCWGTTAGNNNGKIIKLFFGTAVVRQIGSAAINNKDWRIDAVVVRTGASAQDAFGTEIVDNVSLNTHSEPAESTAATIIIKTTGEGAATNDVVQQGMLVEYLN